MIRHVAVCSGLLALALSAAALLAAQQSEVPPPPDADQDVVCHEEGKEGTGEKAELRTWRFVAPRGGTTDWTLVFRKGESGTPVRLRLPGATPKVEAARGRAQLQHKTGTGGVIIDLDASDGAGTLDVYVSHGVEVNVDPDLNPRVEEMNTRGSIRVTCEVPRM